MDTDLAAQRAMDRLARNGFDTLDEMDRTLATVWMFAAGVSNHGFSGYFSSRRGDLAFHAPEALCEIGALEMAALAAEANEVFGDDGPPRDLAMRRAQLKTLGEPARRALAALDDRYFSSEEDVDEYLERYRLTSRATR